jgi:hypothetical protein
MPDSTAYMKNINKQNINAGRAFRVSRSRQQIIRKRKQRIAHRLRIRNWPEQEEPMFRASNIHYEISDRFNAINCGGIGAIHKMVKSLGLVEALDRNICLLKFHLPYHESDHILNLAYNILAGGTCLEDIELLRNDEVYLNSLGTQRIPDPTTAGDFCRRFDVYHIERLMDTINAVRLQVWKRQPESFFEEAIIEADGVLTETYGECKEGMDISYKGTWGFHPLVVSLANTCEPLFLVNRSGNRPSHEGAYLRYDQSIALCREAGFKKITLRGDTDFTQTRHLDRWDEEHVRFVFGMDAMPNLIQIANNLPKSAWQRLNRPPKYEVKTGLRRKPSRVKDRIVQEREFKRIHLESEDVAEFSYSPTRCKKTFRIVVVRKNLSVEKGERVLFDDIRYFFYLTNDLTAHSNEIVFEANDRCNQENLIAQLRCARALNSPLHNLRSNWAYMVIVSLAWTFKAWFALILPEKGRWGEKYKREKEKVLKMEFKTFLNFFLRMPTQIIRKGRKIIYRFLSWNQWQPVFFRAFDQLHGKLLC